MQTRDVTIPTQVYFEPYYYGFLLVDPLVTMMISRQNCWTVLALHSSALLRGLET